MLISKYVECLFPCNLRIKLNSDVSESLIEKLKEYIDLAYDSFFYNILVSNWSIDFNNIKKYGKEEPKGAKFPGKETVLVFPTDLFYKSLEDMHSLHYISSLELGITHFPIYSSNEKKLIFLYGEANISRKCAVVSTYNLSDYQSISPRDNGTIEKRIIKECIHEIGHLILGIRHCINSDCVMNYSTNLERVDKKNTYPCDMCHEKLENIRDNYNF